MMKIFYLLIMKQFFTFQYYKINIDINELKIKLEYIKYLKKKNENENILLEKNDIDKKIIDLNNNIELLNNEIKELKESIECKSNQYKSISNNNYDEFYVNEYVIIKLLQEYKMICERINTSMIKVNDITNKRNEYVNINQKLQNNINSKIL